MTESKFRISFGKTDLKIEKTTGIANTAKRDVVALLNKNDS